MDIHRCRFVPFPPASINALAFSHSHVSKDQVISPPRLAVGRANGDIEIWNPQGGIWLQENIIRGGKDRSIDGLVWTQDPNEEVEGRIIIGRSRLFSIGYTTTITEWDLATAKPLKQVSGNHGEIWCITAQPTISAPKKDTSGENDRRGHCQSLVAGCTDGALVLYSTQDDDIQLQKVLVRPSSKKAKIISITFQNRSIVVVGCTDSTIRIYDIRNGSLLRSMTLGSGPKGGPKDIIVWSIKALKDGTIISGDSTGELKIWDGKTYTLRQRILAHKQDILCLTTNEDGTSIFTGGMDRRTVFYKPMSKAKGRWTEVAHRRFHIHDVKAMASFEGPGMSVFVSGGHDSSPIIVPMGKYGFENHRTLPYFSQDLVVKSAPKARLFICWWDREIWIWKIEKFSTPVDEDVNDEYVQGKKLVAKIYIKGEANITSADISIEGNILVVATIADVKAFNLRPSTDKDKKGLNISTLKIPTELSQGARLITLSPDGRWICTITPENQILLARITQSSSSVNFFSYVLKLDRLDRHIDKLVSLGGLGAYPRIINQVAFSNESQLLAVSDLEGYIDSYVLIGNEDLTSEVKFVEKNPLPDEDSDSETDCEVEEKQGRRLIYGQYWTRNPLAKSIPQLHATPVVLSFRPSSRPIPDGNDSVLSLSMNNTNVDTHKTSTTEYRLLIITAESEVYEFDILKGKLSEWSRRNPPSVFPERFKKTLETVRGVIWDINAGRERVWLYSVGWLWMFDLRSDFNPVNLSKSKRIRKRKRGICGAGGDTKNSEINFRSVKPDDGSNTFGQVNKHIDVYDHDLHLENFLLNLPEKNNFEGDEVKDAIKSSENELETSANLQKNSRQKKDLSSYHTFKYRPILGVATLKHGPATETGLEVVLVERPIWESDLPPRYYGEQEWRDREIDLWKV